MKVGDLVKLSSRAKVNREVRDTLSEIHDKCGVIVHAQKDGYRVLWAATMESPWKHNITWERWELKFAKRKKIE